MNQTLVNKVETTHLKRVPDLRPGQTVKVHQRIKEGEKERIQMFEGLVISVRGPKGLNQTFTVRKVVSGIGVEKIFPTHSATIEKIEIVKEAKIRRAKLYYMRDRSGKSARLKETYLTENDVVYHEAPTIELSTKEPTLEPTQEQALDETTEATPEAEGTIQDETAPEATTDTAKED